MEVPGRTASGAPGLVGRWRAPEPPLRRQQGRPWARRSWVGGVPPAGRGLSTTLSTIPSKVVDRSPRNVLILREWGKFLSTIRAALVDRLGDPVPSPTALPGRADRPLAHQEVERTLDVLPLCFLFFCLR